MTENCGHIIAPDVHQVSIHAPGFLWSNWKWYALLLLKNNHNK